MGRGARPCFGCLHCGGKSSGTPERVEARQGKQGTDLLRPMSDPSSTRGGQSIVRMPIKAVPGTAVAKGTAVSQGGDYASSAKTHLF